MQVKVTGNETHYLVNEKIGWDWANKKMIARVYEPLREIMTGNTYDKNWTNVVRYMFASEGRPEGYRVVNGYYSSIRSILKGIGVIELNGKKGMSKGPNWDRFYDEDTDWSWFITDTSCGGRGTIVK